MKHYGIILKQERTERNITQEQLAKAIGISQQAISYYENDKNEPTIGICERIADYYGITLDELIGRDKDSNIHLDQRHNNGTINNNF